MSRWPIKPENLDRILSKEDKDESDARLSSDDTFVAAMKAAIERGDEKAVEGVFVDHTSSFGIRRIYGDAILSVCGSPAAMCVESAGKMDGGTAAMK